MAVARFLASNQNPVGMIVQSMLTEAQFQALNGTSWVLADGRGVSGSVYELITGSSSIPDARGLFLRAAGSHGTLKTANNVAFSATLGSTQNDQIQGHFHSLPSSVLDSTGGAGWPSGIGSANFDVTATVAATTDGTNGTPRTGSETRPANLAVNTFIKINP